MKARTEVPEWCRTDVEDAIAHAVMRRVLELTDRVEATDTDAVRRSPVAYLRLLLAAEQGDIARDVIAALQGVGVPLSGATGAGAEYERSAPRRVMVADPVRGEQLATAANGDAATTWRCEGCGATVHYWPFDGIPGAVCEYVRGETDEYAWVAHAPRCVGMAFSESTGAGAGRESAGPGDDELAYWSPVTGDVFTDRPSWPTTMADGVPGVVPLAAGTAIPTPCSRPGCGYGYPWGESDRCDEHEGMANR